jgi:hypothetical protein
VFIARFEGRRISSFLVDPQLVFLVPVLPAKELINPSTYLLSNKTSTYLNALSRRVRIIDDTSLRNGNAFRCGTPQDTQHNRRFFLLIGSLLDYIPVRDLGKRGIDGRSEWIDPLFSITRDVQLCKLSLHLARLVDLPASTGHREPIACWNTRCRTHGWSRIVQLSFHSRTSPRRSSWQRRVSV